MKTQLLVKKRIRCRGFLHDVGLNSKGQLYLPNHEKKELEEWLLMGEFGNNPCKCAQIYGAWKQKRFHNEIVPIEMRALMAVNDIEARRILKKMRKHRDKNAHHIVDLPILSLEEWKKKNSTSWGHACDVVEEWIIDSIYNSLVARGWPTNMFTRNSTALAMKESRAYRWRPNLVYTRSTAGKYVNIDIGTNHIEMPISSKEDVNLTTLLDNVETLLIHEILTEHREHQRTGKIVDGKNVLRYHATGAKDINYKFPDVHIKVKEIVDENGFIACNIEFLHEHLTPQAIKLFVDRYYEFFTENNGLFRSNTDRLNRLNNGISKNAFVHRESIWEANDE